MKRRIWLLVALLFGAAVAWLASRAVAAEAEAQDDPLDEPDDL